ncbi:ferredoxin [Kitasatospora sp. NPDC059673]|uniref:ferredoxin n=1 Tax=Kitasatospora sp. NPDC059673 TaxID=3346901 RepID=UPI003674B411
MLVSVDQDRCCGAGQCVRNAPEVFDQREEDGVVVLLDARPPADLRSAVEDAAAACPSGAVRISEGAR